MDVLGLLDLPLWLLLLIATVSFSYFYAVQPYSFWTSRGVSGPRPKPFLGNSQLLTDATTKNMLKWTEKYGRIFGIYLYRSPMLVVTDYDIMKQIAVKEANTFIDRSVIGDKNLHSHIINLTLFFASGQTWKRIRQIVTPTFSIGKIKGLTSHMNHSAEVLTQLLCQSAKPGEKINLKKFFGDFTMNVIASTAFSMNLQSENSTHDSFVKNAKIMLSLNFRQKLMLFLEGALPWVNRTFENFIDLKYFSQNAVAFFDKMVKEMIAERKMSSTRPNDFLELLLNAESTDKSTGKKYLNNDEVVAQCILFFLAGYETAAMALHYATYELARNPDIQNRLISEIDGSIKNQEVTYADVKGLKYLDAVVQETLRMYPPVPSVFRQNVRPTTVAGISIPPKTGIFIPLLIVNYDPKLYPNPEKFDPDRFLAEKSAPIPLAFGLGARHCVGLNFALVEMKIALVHMLRKVMFTDPPKEELELLTFGILTPKTPIKLGIVLR